jgi:hypothetical protein
MWHVNEDDSLHAWGEDSAWHEVGASTDIDLSEYAKLKDPDQEINARELSADEIYGKEFIGDGSRLTGIPEFDSSELEELIAAKANLDDKEQSITAKEFIGDGSKLTNIKVDLEGGYVGGPLETAPTAPAMVNDNGEVEPKNEQIEAGTWGGWVGIFVGLKLVSDAGWVWDSNDGSPNVTDDKPTVVYINGTPFDVDVDHQWGWGHKDEDKVFIPLVGEDFFPELVALVGQQVSVSWYPGTAGALDGYATEEWVQGYAMPKDISKLPTLN